MFGDHRDNATVTQIEVEIPSPKKILINSEQEEQKKNAEEETEFAAADEKPAIAFMNISGKFFRGLNRSPE